MKEDKTPLTVIAMLVVSAILLVFVVIFLLHYQ